MTVSFARLRQYQLKYTLRAKRRETDKNLDPTDGITTNAEKNPKKLGILGHCCGLRSRPSKRAYADFRALGR